VDQKQREILHTFARCGTVVATLLATLTCVIYGYGAVGLELFGSEVTRNRGFCLTGDETYANRSGVVVTQDVLGSMGATQYMFGSAQNSTNSTGNPINNTDTVSRRHRKLRNPVERVSLAVPSRHLEQLARKYFPLPHPAD